MVPVLVAKASFYGTRWLAATVEVTPSAAGTLGDAVPPCACANAGTREVLFVVPPLGGLTSGRLKAVLRTRRRLPLHSVQERTVAVTLVSPDNWPATAATAFAPLRSLHQCHSLLVVMSRWSPAAAPAWAKPSPRHSARPAPRLPSTTSTTCSAPRSPSPNSESPGSRASWCAATPPPRTAWIPSSAK